MEEPPGAAEAPPEGEKSLAAPTSASSELESTMLTSALATESDVLVCFVGTYRGLFFFALSGIFHDFIVLFEMRDVRKICSKEASELEGAD